MNRGRRLCSGIVVLTLLLALPLGAPRGCVDCPPGCPMHARREAASDKPSSSMGCHRSRPQPSGEVCLRSACGHDATTSSDTGLLAVPRKPLRVSVAVASHGLPGDDLLFVSRTAPEPPTEPPRSFRG